MAIQTATAIAHPNIAFIKYWGNVNHNLRLPANGSISMNLNNLVTQTSIIKKKASSYDSLMINGIEQSGTSLVRIQSYLSEVRQRYGRSERLRVVSENNFPTSAGIASSASAFAALAVAINAIYELNLNQDKLSALARLGSGSASRSIPPGFCEWVMGNSHADSFARSFAPTSHWELWDCIILVKSDPKEIGSTKGHHIAPTSPFQDSRIAGADERLLICRQAILNRDFEKLADIIELDSNMMHSVMMTSKPSIMYWRGPSVFIMHEVRTLRASGIQAAFTLDAGSNVHVICENEDHHKIKKHFKDFPGVIDVISSPVGNGAELVSSR